MSSLPGLLARCRRWMTNYLGRSEGGPSQHEAEYPPCKLILMISSGRRGWGIPEMPYEEAVGYYSSHDSISMLATTHGYVP